MKSAPISQKKSMDSFMLFIGFEEVGITFSTPARPDVIGVSRNERLGRADVVGKSTRTLTPLQLLY